MTTPPRWWWAAVAAIVVSLFAIVLFRAEMSRLAFRSAIIASSLILLIVVFWVVARAAFSRGAGSFRAEYDRDVALGLLRTVATLPLTEADIAPLPAAVRRYIRLSGAIGQPRVGNFRARFHGKIRGGPNARWMPFTGEQVNVYDPPSRLFLMDASLFGIPFQALHRFVGPSATMRVKVASIVTVVDARGPVMDEAETVTLFNDLCVFAPGALIDPKIRWEEIAANTVAASFTNLAHTIRATLSFNERGELANFVADGRAAMSSDGKSFEKMPWSTPLGEYRAFGKRRLMSRGEGIWRAPAGDYAYLSFDLDAIEYNVAETIGRETRAERECPPA